MWGRELEIRKLWREKATEIYKSSQVIVWNFSRLVKAQLPRKNDYRWALKWTVSRIHPEEGIILALPSQSAETSVCTWAPVEAQSRLTSVRRLTSLVIWSKTANNLSWKALETNIKRIWEHKSTLFFKKI